MVDAHMALRCKTWHRLTYSEFHLNLKVRGEWLCIPDNPGYTDKFSHLIYSKIIMWHCEQDLTETTL